MHRTGYFGKTLHWTAHLNVNIKSEVILSVLKVLRLTYSNFSYIQECPPRENQQHSTALVGLVEILTVQSGQKASQRHSCRIHQRRQPAADLVSQWPPSSPHTPSWRQRRTVRSGHEGPGSEIQPLEQRDTECEFKNKSFLQPTICGSLKYLSTAICKTWTHTRLNVYISCQDCPICAGGNNI